MADTASTSNTDTVREVAIFKTDLKVRSLEGEFELLSTSVEGKDKISSVAFSTHGFEPETNAKDLFFSDVTPLPLVLMYIDSNDRIREHNPGSASRKRLAIIGVKDTAPFRTSAFRKQLETKHDRQDSTTQITVPLVVMESDSEKKAQLYTDIIWNLHFVNSISTNENIPIPIPGAQPEGYIEYALQYPDPGDHTFFTDEMGLLRNRSTVRAKLSSSIPAPARLWTGKTISRNLVYSDPPHR